MGHMDAQLMRTAGQRNKVEAAEGPMTFDETPIRATGFAPKIDGVARWLVAAFPDRCVD